MRTTTNISGIELGTFVMNAAGVNDTTWDELKELSTSKTAAIVMKTCTIKPRAGNPEPRLARLTNGYIQSMGLPNEGHEQYLRYSRKLQKYGVPVIASVAGSGEDEFWDLVKAFNDSPVAAVELNLSCPNLEALPIAYSPSLAEKIIEQVMCISQKPVGIKLPPLQVVSIGWFADIVRAYGLSYVATSNSLGNTLVIDPETEQPYLKATRGYGALSGAYMKPIALAQVRRFYMRLELYGIPVIGVGGIATGKDAFEYLLAGASAVQVGSAILDQGLAALEKINQELEEILDRKGYSSIDQARGKLILKP